MKRFLIVLMSILLLIVCVDAKPRKKSIKMKSRASACSSATNIDACPLVGCNDAGKLDPLLNKRKNIRTSSKTPTDRSLAWMKSRPNPTNYKPGEERSELTQMGEGDMIRLIGYVLVVRPGSPESCNCYLTKGEADNHLVVVTSTTVNKYKLPPNAKAKNFNRVIKLREPESVTVEFTPRVRKDHPNFSDTFLEPLVRKTVQGALKVRDCLCSIQNTGRNCILNA